MRLYGHITAFYSSDVRMFDRVAFDLSVTDNKYIATTLHPQDNAQHSFPIGFMGPT